MKCVTLIIGAWLCCVRTRVWQNMQRLALRSSW
jgi:hypothetical protein